ncbi:hypothetical protein Tco_1348017 [Tanacetum coccineum]
MYDSLSLEVWSITFLVGLQIKHAEDLTVFSPFPTTALTTAFGLAVVVMDIQEKDKNRSQNDKTEHENEKNVKSQKDKSQSQQKVKVKVNPGMRH